MNEQPSPATPLADKLWHWPLWQRALHWTLALSVLAAWATHESGRIHEWIGYTALVLAALRLVLGFIGPPIARFSSFVRSIDSTLAYARLVRRAGEPRYLNHNPLGAWMVLALLMMALLSAGSGWLYTTDALWGLKWMEELHEALANGLLGLIGLHLAGVFLASRRHRENLAASMLHGRKERRSGDL